MKTIKTQFGAGLIGCALLMTGLVMPATADLPDTSVLRSWIEDMKASERGPFRRIRWFCKDGAVLPPDPYACADHGGGSQHGEWTDRVKQLRAAGYMVANIYADLDVTALTADEHYPDTLNQMIIEQFLIASDNGWIFRKARYYRGALQEEGERRGARRLLLRLAQDPTWLNRRYLPFRTAVRFLGHSEDTKSIGEVRRLAGSLADRDPDFGPLRNKIHVRPDYSDAAAVREYISHRPGSSLSAEYQHLAGLIEAAYAGPSAAQLLERLANSADASANLAALSHGGVNALTDDSTAEQRFTATAELLSELRIAAVSEDNAGLRLAIAGASHALENDHFVAATVLRDALADATRARQLDWLKASVKATYGAGLLSSRQLGELIAALDRLRGATRVDLASYKQTLQYLALVPGWSSQRQRFHFGESVDRFNTIAPRAGEFLQDQLRASPLFFFSQVLDGLLQDANRLAGVRHELFGEEIGAGLRALNPGLASGRLRSKAPQQGDSFDPSGIYLLASTLADLPPVAGILTAGEGNPLSHVQLLARNLGIPNVAVDESLIPRLHQRDGGEVVLAVSLQGSVRLIDAATAPRVVRGYDGAVPDVLIRADLNKLDLDRKGLISLSSLRASDSGRSVGPKAAKLGELHHHFPEAVADGLAIPFGVFADLLSQPYRQTGLSVLQWMARQYRRIEKLNAGTEDHANAVEDVRLQLQQWIESADPGDDFRARLRAAMEQEFGGEGTYGVFVRSDTNVEDLPGFTGAGLNLTVPNVVGFDNVLEAISRVWASPFTQRAYAWRQSRMDQPEHVYPAVLLLRSVAVDKSGVLVTQDVETGDSDWFSVAVNEGVGGAVDGQAAESLRVHLENGKVRLMAQATAPVKRVIRPRGGIEKLPVSGRDHVLEVGEIAQLIEFVEDLPGQFPAIVDANGKPAPADIEFGFVDNRLMLFQIRPFLDSGRAHTNSYLRSLDADMRRLEQVIVELNHSPEKRS